MFFVLLSVSLTILACLRGWFPWALIVCAIPFAMPFLASHGYHLGGPLGYAALGVPGGALSLGALALMTLFGND